MITLTAHFEDGDTLTTRINATPQEAEAYYVGQTFNVGIGPEDNPKRCTRIEIH